MLFAISVDETGRAILDDYLHGDVIAVVEAKSWKAARRKALAQKEMDPFGLGGGG